MALWASRVVLSIDYVPPLALLDSFLPRGSIMKKTLVDCEKS
jgi:hypothetical protein